MDESNALEREKFDKVEEIGECLRNCLSIGERGGEINELKTEADEKAEWVGADAASVGRCGTESVKVLPWMLHQLRI